MADGGYPIWLIGVPQGTPVWTGWGTPPARRQSSRASTCDAGFTQEDFLVLLNAFKETELIAGGVVYNNTLVPLATCSFAVMASTIMVVGQYFIDSVAMTSKVT